jgi:hypothetical protein
MGAIGERRTILLEGKVRGSEAWELESLMGRASRAERNERAKDISVILGSQGRN